MYRFLVGSFLVLAAALAFADHLAARQGGKIQRTAPVGGGSGNEFITDVVPPGGRLLTIQVKTGRLVDAVRFTYEDAAGQVHTVTFGGNGGVWQTPHTVPKGVTLVGISGRSGTLVDSIRFHFSDGSQTPLHGGGGGSDYQSFLPKPNGRYVGAAIGFYGRSGRVIDRIGLQYRLR
jgi:hypothetical protein